MSAPLTAAALLAACPATILERLQEVHAAESIDSTNAHLLSRDVPARGRFSVSVARTQTAGRGRRGRRWLTPADSGLCLSVSTSLPSSRPDLPTLALVTGLAVWRTLSALGVDDVGLKWPNDLYRGDAKLGGILTELRTLGDTAHIVVGVGLNLALPAGFAAQVMALGGQRPADLIGAGIEMPPVSALAGRLVGAVCDALLQFAAEGFGPFLAQWPAADVLHGRVVRIRTDAALREGIACGLQADGALLVDCGGVMTALNSAEVSLRMTA